MLNKLSLLIFLGLLAACVAIAPESTQSDVRNERLAAEHLNAGHALMESGAYEDALAAYTRAAGEIGLTAVTLGAIGSANLRLGRLHQAQKQLEQAVELDPKSVPAWNNLGVLLMERGETAEAGRVFRNAFALDDGNSEEIRENLRLALAKLENPSYAPAKEEKFELVRQGSGQYLLLRTPDSKIEQ